MVFYSIDVRQLCLYRLEILQESHFYTSTRDYVETENFTEITFVDTENPRKQRKLYPRNLAAIQYFNFEN